MRIHIISFMLLTTLFSCKKEANEADTSAYFGGEIINPTNDYVLLFSPNSQVNNKSDTLFLNNKNRFFTKLSPLKSGLYTFIHGGQYQMVLLEPRDSVMLRLNTIDFDESLVFTGDGARKNNFLINIFLENEADRANFINFSQMEPEKFESYIDSSRTERLNGLSEFSNQRNLSPLFDKVAETSVNYGYFSAKEMYPFAYYGYKNLKNYKDLPSSFYDYRKDIDYNISSLGDFFIYNRFLYAHFNNMALEKFYANAPKDAVFNRNSVVYNLEKLRLMNERITNDTIKNKLLKNTARDFISMCEDTAAVKQVLASYLQKTTNADDRVYIERLSKAINKLKPGKIIPDVELVSYNNEDYKFSDLITQPTVIYFWSSNLKIHYKNSHYKIRDLKKKYPNINFIAININDSDKKYWKRTLDEFKFPIDSEYQFKDPFNAKQTLVLNTVYKIIVVDKEMRIVDTYYNMFHSKFEDKLQELNN
ncbi:redoxin domain-containing protein [Gelidibacter maritimus]|uniref:Redoxin domain-containing protein n=1 Tax=Gelidibacter maritimus TaxID=2761487 RepID=A0A7W2M1U7_9FLAO|nr:redoxin domain-containing protein [Gelidibacter maritimus]MBA6151177.1 redoxin domain-containing protein [Gelidibacter maritimus]